MLDKVIKEEAEKICQQYRVKKSKAEEILRAKIFAQALLLASIEKAEDYKQLRRSKTYKRFIKKIRKEIYYSLRRYHKSEALEEAALKELADFVKGGGKIEDRKWKPLKAKLVSLHVSTAERQEDIVDFNREILKITKNDETILDLGSGFYPLTFPFSKANNLKKYICLEKDKKAVQVLKLFGRMIGDEKFEVFDQSIGFKNPKAYLPKGTESFDTVFMLKLIPVIFRQERKLIDKLKTVPARKILITANKESMTKRKDILRREDRTLKKFIVLTNRKIVRKLDFKTEFGYLIS